jgi:alpha-ketoglutarate-dependent taurine dioxygenase
VFTVSMQTDVLKQGMLEMLSVAGCVALVDVETTKQVLDAAERLGSIWLHRDSDEDGVTTLQNVGRLDPGERGYSSDALPLHTDGSSATLPPAFVFFWCEVEPPSGGDGLLSDARKVYEEILSEDRRLITILESSNCQRLLGKPAELEAPLYDNVRPRWRFVRHRRDELVRVAQFAEEAVKRFEEVANSCQFPLQLKRRTGYVINNGWFLHGRTAFAGYRVARRVTISVHDSFRAGDYPLDLGFAVR